jgi:hypothetical protein
VSAVGYLDGETSDLDATVANQFSVGDGASGVKSVRFNGVGALLLQANPTVARTVTIPDASGSVLLHADNPVEQRVTWTAADRWVRIDTPFSSNDSNPDLLRVFNGANQTFRLNGNGESRALPSAINRVGGRAFEFLNGSEDIFWECSTNPSNSALRETLLGVYGTLHPDWPGWVLARDGFVVGEGDDAAPFPGGGWLNATLGTNVTAGTAIAPSTQREGDRIFLRGRLAWSGATFAANATLLTVHADHAPTTAKTFSVRTSPNSNLALTFELASSGALTTLSGIASSTAFVGVDGLSYDLS